jgi:hypothetical protein
MGEADNHLNHSTNMLSRTLAPSVSLLTSFRSARRGSSVLLPSVVPNAAVQGVLVGLMCVLLGTFDSSAQPASTRVVAVTGDAPPNGDGRFRTLWWLGGINDQGKVSFAVDLIGTSQGTANNQGLFLGDGTSLREIVRKGDPLPIGQGTVSGIEVNRGFTLNQASQLAYLIRASTAVGGLTQLYRSPAEPGASTLIVSEGENSPTGAGYISASLTTPFLSDSGNVIFQGLVYGDPDRNNAFGVFSSDGTGISTLLAPGQLDASGAYVVAVKRVIGLGTNSSGQLACFADLIRPPNVSSEGGLVMIREGTNATVVVRENAPVPDGAGSFNTFRPSGAINDAGDLAIVGEVTGTIGQYDALYLVKQGVVSEVARSGFNAPDNRWRFRRFSGFDINNRSQVAFVANDLDGFSGGIFRGDGTRDGLVRLVGEDQPAPNGNGTLFIQDDPALINDAGQVLFYTVLRNTAPGTSSNWGIFLHDDRLGLLTVARRGDPFLGSSINALTLSETSLNQHGDVAFSFTLFDGRAGVAVWSYRAMADNKPPVGPSYQGAVSQGNVLTLSSTNLLQGVSDPDGGAVFLNPIPARTVRGGSLSYSTFTRIYTYIPPTGFVGVDEFSYVIRDDAGVSTTFTGQIQVSGPNRPPVSTGLTYRSGAGGESVTISLVDVLAATTDPDGDPISVTSVPTLTLGSVPVSRHGDTLQLTTDRSLSADSLDLTVGDNRGGTATVRVTMLLPDELEGIRTESGSIRLTLVGSLGTWNVQRAPSPLGPWGTIGTVSISRYAASPSLHRRGRGCPTGTVCRGAGEFQDPNPSSVAAFYRMSR